MFVIPLSFDPEIGASHRIWRSRPVPGTRFRSVSSNIRSMACNFLLLILLFRQAAGSVVLHGENLDTHAPLGCSEYLLAEVLPLFVCRCFLFIELNGKEAHFSQL